MTGPIVYVSKCELLCNTTYVVSVLSLGHVSVRYRLCGNVGYITTHLKAMYVYLDTGALSPNHCCRAKIMCYVLWVCVYSLSFPKCKAHAPYYTVMYGVSSCYIFPRYSSTSRISGKRYWTQNMCFDLIYIYQKYFAHTLRICNTAVPRQQWLREHASVLRYAYIAASLVPSQGTAIHLLVFVVWKVGKYYRKVAAQCLVQLCWWSYMIQQWQGSGVDGGSWHHINCTCSAGPPYWARGTLTTHRSDSLIYQKKRSKKWMKSSFLFSACAFLSPCVSFLYTVLGDLCQARYKMLGDDFYSFYIGLYAFLLSSRYVSLFFFFFFFLSPNKQIMGELL